MTDPFSAPRRSRRRSGRHRQQPVRRTQSTPLPPEQARRNRDAAFGSENPRRAWIGSPSVSAASPADETADETVDAADTADTAPGTADIAPTRDALHDVPAPAPSHRGSAAGSADDPAQGAAQGAAPSADEARPVRRPRGRRAAFPIEDLPASPAEADGPGSASDAGVHDAWAADAAAPAGDPAEAPLSPRDEPVPATPRAAAPAGSGPRIVPGRPRSAASAPTAPALSASAQSNSAQSASAQSSAASAAESASTSSSAAAAPAGPAAVGAAAGAASQSGGEPRSDGDSAGPRSGAVAAGGTGRNGTGAGKNDGRGGNADGGFGGGGNSGDGGKSGDGGDGSVDRRDDSAADDSGSLAKVAGWTVLTSALPGSGLLTTPLRKLGAAMLALLLVVVLVVAAVVLFGDPLRTAATLGTRRGVLIAALVVTVVVGLVWAAQIVLANLAQGAKQRLEGSKCYVALALAALMVILVAVPFGRGVQSLWALQGLMGSESVFGGDRNSQFASGEDPWADTERLNIMLLGQDAGADRTGTRPDTIMVASIDTATGRTALFSIPRNLEHVRFPEGTVAAEEFPDGFRYYGRNQDLINAVWAWAEENPDLFPGDPEPGLTATRWAVEETLGLKTDYYAMVNLQGFEDMVDAIGGVDLVVERRIPIGGGASKVEGYIEPGEQTLDGFHALWYARSREGSNDFNRMCRQQRIVRAVAEEADPTTLALSVPRLVTATENNIETDIPVNNVDAFVDLALRIKDGGFTSYPITQDVTFSGNPDWDYLKEWTQASIEDSMAQGEPESVRGETEPGSTEPAETGAPPEEDTASSEAATTEEATTSPTPSATPTEESTSATPTEESSTSGTATPSETATEEPVIDQDPLKSCLPGADQTGQ